jgi:hypothetical protein
MRTWTVLPLLLAVAAYISPTPRQVLWRDPGAIKSLD